MIKKFCLTCGNVFNVSENRRNSAKFCSRECKHTFSRTNKKCLFCGKPFKTPNHLNRNTVRINVLQRIKEIGFLRFVESVVKDMKFKGMQKIQDIVELIAETKGFQKALLEDLVEKKIPIIKEEL